MSSPFGRPYHNEPSYQTNSYACTDCDTEWEDNWYCGCDDECPSCGTVMTPYDEEIIATNHERLSAHASPA